MGKNEREENGFSGPENHNQEEEEEEEEKKKQLKEVPSWRKQLTVRAFVVSFVLSILFSFIVMKLNLTTGIIPSLSVSAGLLGFFFVKTWTKLLHKSGLLRQPKYKAFDDLGQPGSHTLLLLLLCTATWFCWVKGFSSLPKNCLLLCYVFFGAAILINLIKDLVGKKWGRFIPLPMAMAIPFYIGSYFAIDMCVGSLILFVWEKINKAKADALAPAVASGLICGDGLNHQFV